MGRIDQCRGFVLAGSNRFFDQNVKPGLETGQTNRVMQQRRHCNTDRFNLRQHLAVIRKPTATELFGGHAAAFRIWISNANEISVA